MVVSSRPGPGPLYDDYDYTKYSTTKVRTTKLRLTILITTLLKVQVQVQIP